MGEMGFGGVKRYGDMHRSMRDECGNGCEKVGKKDGREVRLVGVRRWYEIMR